MAVVVRTSLGFTVVGLGSLALSCASLFGPAPTTGPPHCPGYEIIQIGAGTGVIFPAGVSQSDRYPPGKVTDYWTPTADDVRRAELRIHSYLAENASLLASKFSSYSRQYTGFYLDGQKLISTFFFCDPPPSDDLWCKPFGVDDGGDCYFHIEYDVANDQCEKLDVNGST